MSTTRHLDRVSQPLSSWMAHWNKASRLILVNASSIIGSNVVTSVLGVVYWWLAARLFPPASVGFAAAAISAMTLLATFAEIGFGTLVIGELSRFPGRAGSLIVTVLLIVGALGCALGILGAFVAPEISSGLEPLAANVGTIMLFAAGVGVTAVAMGLDDSVVGLLHGEIQLTRNTLFATVKLFLLLLVGIWLANASGMAMYATWVAGSLLSLVGLAGIAAARGQRVRISRPQWTMLRGLGRPALGHIQLNLSLIIPSLALPIIVASMLSVTMSAYFYIPWMMGAFLYAVPGALTFSLFAASAGAPLELAQKIRLTLGLSLAVSVLANIVLLLGSGFILQLFGSAYAEYASWTLRILGLAVFPVTIRSHFVAVSRIRRRLSVAALALTAGAVCELVLATLGAHFGDMAGLSMGWLAAVCLEAILMTPTVYRAAAHGVAPQAADIEPEVKAEA